MSDAQIGKARSLWGDAWQRLKRNRLAMVCLGVISLYLVVGLLDYVPVKLTGGKVAVTLLDWSFDTYEQLYGQYFGEGPGQRDTKEDELADEGSYAPPGTGPHLLGTDIHGQDVLYKMLKGVNTALTLGLLTAAISIPLGLVAGMVAGYFGGLIDDAVVYIYSTLACIPGILMLIALMTVMQQGVVQLCIALGVTGWVGLCRLVRGETLKLREADYVLASRALGAGAGRIMLSHILPNLFHIIIITFTLGFSGIVMSEAVLTYLGIGVAPQTISWGRMIQQAQMELSREPTVWWQFASAATALFVLVLALNVFGDALRDALDPKLRIGRTAE